MEQLAEVRRALVDPAASSFADVVQAQAQMDWVVWARLANDLDREESAVRAGDAPALVQQVELAAIPGDVGRQAHWSEAQVSRIAAQARRLRDRTPRVWVAFENGRVDQAKAREIAVAVDKLQRAESIQRLDAQVVDYAETHVVTEVRRWLKLFIARVEADLFNERSERQRADRYVDVVHGDDGMSWLMLHNTSIACAAIDKRLTKEAKALGADDPRTLQQRRADLLAAWATTNEAGEAAINADIAVTIQASTLARADNAPAAAADGSWVVPAAWILELAKYDGNNVFWHRMILDPVTDDVLAHEYKGRFAPEILAKAIEFRDGVCQATGCCRPASQCDMDHRIPHEAGGPTAGWNMGPYCRRHHKLKGFGLIDVGPTTTSPPGRSRNTPLHAVGIPDISRAEEHLQAILTDWELRKTA